MSEHRGVNIPEVVKVIFIILAVFLAILLVFRIGLFLAPFLIAFLLSSMLEPIISFLSRKAKLPRKVVAPVTLLVFITSFAFLLALVILRLINEIKSFSKNLPLFFSQLYDTVNIAMDKIVKIYEWLPEEMANNLETIIVNMTKALMDNVDKLANSIVKGAYATAISIPEALIFVLITILSTYFLLSDRENIYAYLKRQLPDNWIKRFITLKGDMFSALFGYLKALLILMVITFSELFAGFSLIGIKYALLLAFVISIIDVLPVLGTGTVLIPWSIFEMLIGNIKMGVSIIILYGVVMIVRQLIEPKIVGQQIGVHPLLTLLFMYLGLRFFGVGGLILGPITFLFLKNIIDGIFKNKPFKEIIKQTNSSEK